MSVTFDHCFVQTRDGGFQSGADGAGGWTPYVPFITSAVSNGATAAGGATGTVGTISGGALPTRRRLMLSRHNLPAGG
jgi:hypothetical protein